MLHKLLSTTTMFLHKVIKHCDDSHSEKEKYHNLSPLKQLNRYENPRLFQAIHTHTKIHHPSQSNTRMQIKTQSFSYVFHEIMCLHVCRYVFHAESLSLTHIYKYWPWNESNKTSWFLFLLLQFLCILYLTIKYDSNCNRQELTEEQKTCLFFLMLLWPLKLMKVV